MIVKRAFLIRSALSAAACLALAACGGGGGSSDASSGGGGGSTSISGVAGTGAPMVGATVTITCASGSASTTTSGTGAFTATFSSAPTAPCAIKAQGVDGTGEQIVHYAVLDQVNTSASNRANINPATTVIAGAVLSGDPEAFFENAQANLGQITQQKVQTATEQIKLVVGDIDPLKGEYVADKVNELDKKFDQLKIEWNPDSSSFTVTSKVTGTVIGSVSTTNFENEKAAFETRLEDPDIVPTTGPDFAALDSQFGAAINTALKAENLGALHALFDTGFKDGGMYRTAFVDMVWSDSQGGTVGKFTVVGCHQLPGATVSSVDTVSSEDAGKHVCKVAATLTTSSYSDPFELFVIEKTPGQWLAYGDQLNHRIEIKPTMERALRFDGSTLNTGYRTGLQVWVPVPLSDDADAEALPNAEVHRVVVRLGESTLATLARCGTTDYLQNTTGGSSCSGDNLHDMPDGDITKLIDAYNTNKAAPVLTVTVYGEGDQVLDTHYIKLSTLPVTKAAIEAEDSPYQKRFATLDSTSRGALQSLGSTGGTFTLNWTGSAQVEDVNWHVFGSPNGLWGQADLLSATSASFTADSLTQKSYASVYLSAKGGDGRNYWSKYFGCGGSTCH